MSYLTIALDVTQDKQLFHCGQKLLDDYLHKQAKQDVSRRLAACFVLVAEDQKLIKEYYTLSNAHIPKKLLPAPMAKKLPPAYADLPATLLGRLAVDTRFQGQGLGALLLLDALKRSYDTSVNSIASMAVVVDPIDEAAILFYKKYGFIPLPDSGKMFLPMKTIQDLF